MTLTNIRDRGGLTKVTPEVSNILQITEQYFKKKSSGNVHKLNTDDMVSYLILDPDILSNYSQLWENSDKEVALNLLKDILTLYLRVRSFSYAKDKIQQHKMNKKKVRSRSL